MATHRPPRLAQPLTEPYLTHACRAWEDGCSVLLGLWAARHLEYWTVCSYGALVAQVRAALGDDRDYSADNGA